MQNSRELPIPFLKRESPDGLYSWKKFVNHEGHNKPLEVQGFEEAA